MNFTTRRHFLTYAPLSLLGVGLGLGCTNNRNQTKWEEIDNEGQMDVEKNLFFQISLAQWSVHRALEAGKIKPENFPVLAKEELGINAVEYVNQFYVDHSKDERYFQQLGQRASDVGVKNLLIMVDDEGYLGDTNDASRKQAVDNHHKWINAAAALGCHSIRVNAFGEGSKTEVKNAMVDALGDLATYANKSNINVVLENHGLYSSDAQWMVDIVKQVGMDNVGTLPDFGNFCLSAKWGSTQIPCDKAYDRYQGVKEMLPYAKGVSAKSYDFNEDGSAKVIDYERMLRIVKASGFKGYVGIEYEGQELSEYDGIKATKALLQKVGMKITSE